MKRNNIFALALCFLCSCTASTSIFKKAANQLQKDSVISTGYIGVSMYEPATGKYLFQKNANKYFIPASNTKLFTLYVGMKYLEDSLTGIKYAKTEDSLFVFPTGDPTFLHRDFVRQPVYDFIKNSDRQIVFVQASKQPSKYGRGWSWDDMNESFMPQRNQFPMFGNILEMEFAKLSPEAFDTKRLEPFLPDVIINYAADSIAQESKIVRNQNDNIYQVIFSGKDSLIRKSVPFETNGIATTVSYLKQMLQNDQINVSEISTDVPLQKIKTQSSDSLFKAMMYKSDNFFAEQILLMCSNIKMGCFDEEEMIASLLMNEFKSIPQKPRWVDGSGLSRYNLFSPNDFIFILNKIDAEFGEGRLRGLLPTGGKGTLKNFCVPDSGYIYAKTGSMSNIFCISGELITKKKKKLLFSILLNNYYGSSAVVKNAIENYLITIRKEY